MKFKVSRTSVFGDEVQPCAGAVKEAYVGHDVRTFISREDANDPIIYDDWLAHGRNHRELLGPRGGKRGMICDYDTEGWFIEINTLEELFDFMDEHGELVLSWDSRNEAIRKIEIYDSYRE